MKSMNFMRAGRRIQASLLLMSALALGACGFHLRKDAALPTSMRHVHLVVSGGGAFERSLARALSSSGVTVEDDGGPGIAELNVPEAVFSNETLSAGGYVRISQYATHYKVQFNVTDAAGQVLIPPQHIDMSREYTYDATQAVGNAAQVEQIQQSLQTDMVQAILFRLQAAGQHQLAAPAAASSTP
jgi:LPS-assembly lipoprotein